MEVSLKNKKWWGFIHDDLKDLFEEAVLLADRVGGWKEEFYDYAFVVFPAAKAYEGFLKSLFLNMGFITKEDYDGKRFRVGRALNPSLEKHLRETESVYDKIVAFCGDKNLADSLWETWKKGRNLLFHWFPSERNAITLTEARDIIVEIISTIDYAYTECKL